MEVHSYNPNYSGSIDRRIAVQGQAQAKTHDLI
jgi:hypothetical protein